ncbi:unnamed protein product [Caretta caretta]
MREEEGSRAPYLRAPPCLVKMKMKRQKTIHQFFHSKASKTIQGEEHINNQEYINMSSEGSSDVSTSDQPKAQIQLPIEETVSPKPKGSSQCLWVKVFPFIEVTKDGYWCTFCKKNLRRKQAFQCYNWTNQFDNYFNGSFPVICEHARYNTWDLCFYTEFTLMRQQQHEIAFITGTQKISSVPLLLLHLSLNKLYVLGSSSIGRILCCKINLQSPQSLHTDAGKDLNLSMCTGEPFLP